MRIQNITFALCMAASANAARLETASQLESSIQLESTAQLEAQNFWDWLDNIGRNFENLDTGDLPTAALIPLLGPIAIAAPGLAIPGLILGI